MAQGEVLRQLEKILAHPLFHKSHRLSTFLRYVVERTLAGEADALKEFVIGSQVFERGDLFDQQTDNVVRLIFHPLNTHPWDRRSLLACQDYRK